jgi:hypothetical protein
MPGSIWQAKLERTTFAGLLLGVVAIATPSGRPESTAHTASCLLGSLETNFDGPEVYLHKEDVTKRKPMELRGIKAFVGRREKAMANIRELYEAREKQPTQDEIEARAYELYQKDGEEFSAAEYWHKAEAELKKERSSASPRKKAVPGF